MLYWFVSNASKFSGSSKSNQINSWFSAPPTTRTTTHYIVQISSSLELVTVGSPEEECFQAALESWRGTYQLEFGWQPIPCLRSSDGERPLTEFQTGPGDDIIAVGRGSESRLRWDIGDCIPFNTLTVHTMMFICRKCMCVILRLIPLQWEG